MAIKKGEKRVTDIEPKLNTIQKQELISKVAEWMIEGNGFSDIVRLLQHHAPVTLSEAYCKGLLVQARQVLEEESAQTASAVIGVHISIYEEIYAYFHEIEHPQGVNKALKAKEKLLQLHKDETTLVVNNKKKTTIIRREPEYDSKKLTKKENERMMELLKKAGA